MLLLPIILWWAKSPMRFSLGRSRQLICLLSLWAIIAAALPTTRNVVASDPMLPPHQTNPVGHSNSGGNDDDANKITPVFVIREGTVVPPTRGHIVMLGRRWAFVPDSNSVLQRQLSGENASEMSDAKQGAPSKMIRIVSNAEVAPKVSAVFRNTSQLDRVNRLMGPANIVSTNGYGDSSNRASSNQLIRKKAAASGDEDERKQALPGKQLILAENLMLQRIAGAVRNDGSDDRWIVSGIINEFFGENRMVVTTAHRGSSE